MDNVLGVCVKIHPVALFTIVDSYERRQEFEKRVIGTLLGVKEKGTIEIRSCYAVPHNETDEEVAVDMDFVRQMSTLRQQENKAEVMVGWFSTYAVSNKPKYATSPENMMHSVLIHDYYSRFEANTVFVTVDTTLRSSRLDIKAFVKAKVGLPGKTEGVIFTPVPCEIVYSDPERVGIQLLNNTLQSTPVGITAVKTDFQQLESATEAIEHLLVKLVKYTQDVVSGEIPGNGIVGRLLMETVSKVPKLEETKFESMINATMQDLLMVVYLADLTKTQMVLGEKLAQLKS